MLCHVNRGICFWAFFDSTEPRRRGSLRLSDILNLQMNCEVEHNIVLRAIALRLEVHDSEGGKNTCDAVPRSMSGTLFCRVPVLVIYLRLTCQPPPELRPPCPRECLFLLLVGYLHH